MNHSANPSIHPPGEDVMSAEQKRAGKEESEAHVGTSWPWAMASSQAPSLKIGNFNLVTTTFQQVVPLQTCFPQDQNPLRQGKMCAPVAIARVSDCRYNISKGLEIARFGILN